MTLLQILEGARPHPGGWPCVGVVRRSWAPRGDPRQLRGCKTIPYNFHLEFSSPSPWNLVQPSGAHGFDWDAA
jgi:hypothetical protein